MINVFVSTIVRMTSIYVIVKRGTYSLLAVADDYAVCGTVLSMDKTVTRAGRKVLAEIIQCVLHKELYQ